MGRILRCAFTSLVALLFVILIVFLLLFTEVGFSPPAPYRHLANGQIWGGKRLKVSAELAYFWSSNTVKAESAESSLVDSPTGQDGGDKKNSDIQKEGEKKREKKSDIQVETINHERPLEDLNKEAEFRTQRPSATLGTDENKQSVSKKVVPVVIEKESSLTVSKEQADARLQGSRVGEKDSESTEKVLSLSTSVPSIVSTTEVSDTGTSESTTENKMTVVESASLVDRENEDEFDVNYDEEDDNMEDEQSLKLAFSSDEIDAKENATQSLGSFSNIHSTVGYIKPELVERASNVLFKMPCPRVYLSTRDIVKAPWMKPLLQILSQFKRKQVTLVIANNAYRDVLLNWLISATIVSQPPIENILIVSLDHILYSLLQSRDFPTILAPFGTLLNSKHRFLRFFELIMMMRLGFMRLINRMGYDCAMYDIDAIILKNPQVLYEQWKDKDIIGSRGQLPRELWRRWGVAICIGAVFIRSNSKTEKYWEAVHDVRLKPHAMANDQIRLNHGLRHLHVQWEQDRKTNRLHQEYQPAVGSCGEENSPSNLSVVILPFGSMCRFGCRAESRSKYYIWHKGGNRDKKSKMKGAKQGKTWFLKDRWSELHSNMVVDVRGIRWLKRLSTGV